MEKYTKVRNIGTGNMGACALARNNEDGKLYVVKQVDLSRMSKKERQQSLNEARLLSSLRHPNVIRYVDSFLARRSNHLCIVMEYADGGDLNARIKKSAGVNFGEGQVLDWFIQLALSLHYVHQRKILHRDVKAQNIFLTSDNVVKLGDFGIARTLSNTYDQAKTFVGTPYYLSPELILERPYDTRSDVWALGVVLYELLTLRHPFNANDMRGLMQRILRVQYEPVSLLYSAELRHVLTRLLVKEPSQRAHLGEVLELPVVQRRLCEWVQRRSALPHAYVDALVAQNLLPASVMQMLHPTLSSQAPLSSCHAQGLTTATTTAVTSAVTAAAAVAAAAAATAREAAAATAAATHTATAAASRDGKAVGVDSHGGSHVGRHRSNSSSSSNDSSSSSSDGDDVEGSRRATAPAATTAAAAPVVATVASATAQPQHETSSAHNGGGGSVSVPRPTAQPPPLPPSSTSAAAALQPQEPPPLLPPRASAAAAGAAVYARHRSRLPSYVLDLWHPVGNAAAAVGAASAAALSRPTQLAYAPRAYAQPPPQPPPPSYPPCTSRPTRLPVRSHVSARAAAAAAAAAVGGGGLVSRPRAEAPTVATTSMKSSNNNNSDINIGGGGGVYSFASGGGGGAGYRIARGSAVSAAKSSKGGNGSTSNDGGSDAVERHRVRALPLSPSPSSLSTAQPLGLPWSLLTPAPLAMKERAAGGAAAAAAAGAAAGAASGGGGNGSSRATAATAAAAAAAVAAGVYSARVPHNALPSLAARATPLREMRLLAAMEPLYAPYRAPPPQQQQPQQQQPSSLCPPASHVVTRHMLHASNNNNNNNGDGGLQSSSIASKAGRHVLQPLSQQQQQSSSSLPPHSARPPTPPTATTTTTSARGESDDVSSGRAQTSTYAAATAAPQYTLYPATGAARSLPPAVQLTTAATATAAHAALPLSSSPLDVDKSSGRQVNTTTTTTTPSSSSALPPLLRPPRCLQPAPMADVRQLLRRAAQDRTRRQLPGYT